MPGLRDLKSSLSDIRFGKDEPGGGSSGQPYIVQPVGSQWSPGNFDDGIFRHGITAATTRTVADLGRITLWMKDHPLWVAKQVGLQLSNVQLEHREDRDTSKQTTGQGIFSNVGNFISNTVNRVANDVGVTRIYTPTNTLAEIGTTAFGQHFSRHGFSPVMEDSDKYEAVVKDNNENGNNRLVKLTEHFSEPAHATDPIAKYKGGPGSRLGIGETVINRYGNTLTGIDDTETKRTVLLKSFIPMKMKNLLTIDERGVGKIDNITTQDDNIFNDQTDFDFTKKDFREFKNKIKSSDQRELSFTDYEKLNTDTRIGTARSRRPEEYQADYTVTVPGSADKINMIAPFYSDKPFEGVDINNNPVTEKLVNDLIKFRIKAIDNDNPAFGVYLIFRSFINDINRRVDANWQGYSYVGRGEDFYLYNGSKDIISLEFTVVAFSRAEMMPIYQKLNYLYSTLKPDYSKSGKMRGNLIELNVGDYIKYQPGIITSLYFGIPEETNWEIALGDAPGSGTDKDKDAHELPMILKVGMNFIPLWNFMPRKSIEAPFFGIDKTDLRNTNEWIKGKGTRLTEEFKKSVVQTNTPESNTVI